MLQQYHQRRRRHPRDASGSAQCRRPSNRKLVADLARQATDAGIIEIGRKQQRFVVAERGDVLVLALEITRVTRVDLELLGDFRGQRSELWPDPDQPLEIDPRI